MICIKVNLIMSAVRICKYNTLNGQSGYNHYSIRARERRIRVSSVIVTRENVIIQVRTRMEPFSRENANPAPSSSFKHTIIETAWSACGLVFLALLDQYHVTVSS